MRIFLGLALFAAAWMGLLTLVLLPAIVEPLVVDAVRAASPFGTEGLEVDVEVSAAGLLVGSIDSIRLRGSDLDAGGAAVGSMDITISSVSTTDHSFANMAGTVSSLAILVDGVVGAVDRITLSDSTAEVVAVVSLDAPSALALIRNAFADAGMAIEQVQLVKDGIAFPLLGEVVQVPITVQEGALVVPDLFGSSPLAVREPGPDDPWRLIDVAVSSNGVTIDAVLDATSLTRG